MSITKAVGTAVAIASTYGSSVTMSAITNATEAVATLGAGHGVVVGDYLEVTSGWGLLDKRVVRAKTVSTNDITFEGINTTSTTNYPAGSGTGSIRRITAFTDITQRTPNIGTSGGEQQFADITTLQDVVEKKLPTRRSAVDMSLPGFYDLSLSWVSTVQTAAEGSSPVAVKLSYPNGSKLVANAYWSFRDVATIEDSTLRDEITLTFAATPKGYAT